MSKTKIQWTAGDDGSAGETWNPVVGCTRVSAGCNFCYAFQLHDQRHIAWRRGHWPSAPEQYRQPFSHVRLMPARLDDPLHWRKPRRVFVNSMSDLWHDAVPDEFIEQVFEVMARTPQHTYQVLTKRPERMARFVAQWIDDACWSETGCPITDKPLPNVWLGVSVEDQAAADERIPLLLQTPAAVRFLSCEPLLGPVDLIGNPDDGVYGPIWQKRAVQSRTDYGTGTEWDVELESGISWCIIGGESGTHARPMDLAWARSLLDQCRVADTAPFVKQLGAVNAKTLGLRDRHGGTMDEWPADLDELTALRVREFPQTTAQTNTVAREVEVTR